MKRCLISLVLVLAASCAMLGQQSADDTATREDILKLFDVMHIRDQMRQVMDQVVKQMKSMNHEQIRKRDPGATDAQIARLDSMSDHLLRNMPLDGMLDDMIPVYQKHLTKGDVDAMVAFYSTPTGQKILGQMPAMAAEGMQAMQPRLRKMMDETTDKIEKMAEEETAKPNAKPATDAPKQ
ncbi:MAG: DUF2059 domain-containing protein [Candidatus Sulfotelmatobacter sp.]